MPLRGACTATCRVGRRMLRTRRAAVGERGCACSGPQGAGALGGCPLVFGRCPLVFGGCPLVIAAARRCGGDALSGGAGGAGGCRAEHGEGGGRGHHCK
eukprot:2741036-Pyramimonas_sp.AAC.4